MTRIRADMIPQLLGVFAASLFCFVPMGAYAQLEPEAQLGSRIPVKPVSLDTERTGLVTKGFAQCLYRKNTTKTPLLLQNSDPTSIDYGKLKMPGDDIGKYLGMETCLGDQANGLESAISLKFSATQLLAMLQEEDYLAAFKSTPSISPESVESVQRNYVSDGDARRTAQGLGAFSDCLIFRDTANADAVLRAMPGSKDEKAAARALAPTLGACLMQGQTLSFTPRSIRIFAADGLWNRYVRSTAPASAAVNEKR